MVALGVVVLCGGAGLCQRWGMVSAQPPLCSAISLSSLQAKHTQEGSQTWGVNGESGALADMKELGVWEPLAVKLQTYKTAVEVRRADGRTDGRMSVCCACGGGERHCVGQRWLCRHFSTAWAFCPRGWVELRGSLLGAALPSFPGLGWKRWCGSSCPRVLPWLAFRSALRGLWAFPADRRPSAPHR